MPEIVLLRPPLHHGQQVIKKMMKSVDWLFCCAHRGWRKSSLAIDMMIDHLETGQNGFWYAPSMKCIETSNYVDFQRVCQGSKEFFNVSQQSFTIPGKGTCFFISVEKPQYIRGGTGPFAVCEEMGEWEDGVFESYVEPVIRKVGGKMFAPGTPNVVHPNNDFYKFIDDAENHKDQQSYIIPAWGADIVNGVLVENVHTNSSLALRGDFPFPTFQDLQDSYNRAKNKERWRVEYLCHFVHASSEGMSGVDEACILPALSVYGGN